jgi:ATP-dependent DNA helicase DinG
MESTGASLEAPALPTTVTEAFARLAEAIPNFEVRPSQHVLTKAIEAAFGSQEPLLGEGGCGCIQGDALIAINRGGIGKSIRLSDLVVRFHGGRTPRQQKFWDLSIPTFVQREVDGVVRLARLVNAWASGVKRTYTVTTESGRTIRATDEHPFLTDEGWKRLDELQVGMMVHVRGTQRAAVRQPKILYDRVFSMQAHPFANRWKNGGAMVPRHRLVAEAYLNGMQPGEFTAQVTGRGLSFIDPVEFAVHHRDRNPMNNDIGNLMVLTHSEHGALHAAEGIGNNVLYKVISEAVVSVELYGEEETFDLEVEDDPHNFIANGFVVHNTGKSFAALLPAIVSGRRTIYSTATKALQDQLANKDLPFLAEVFPGFTYAVLKGRSNYACYQKVSELDDPALKGEIMRLLADPEFDGQRDHVPISLPIRDADWPKMSSTAEDCPGKKQCSFGGVCKSEAAKEKSQRANIVVVNHALLVTDARVSASTGGNVSMIGPYDQLIIDESHELEEYVSGALETRLKARGILAFATELRNFSVRIGTADVSDIIVDIESAVSALFDYLEVGRLRHYAIVENSIWFENLLSAIGRVTAWISEDCNDAISKAPSEDRDRLRLIRDRLSRRIVSMSAALVSIMMDDETATVRFVEEEFRQRTGKEKVLVVTPVRVSEWLSTHFWNRVSPVLISATIGVGGKADYLIDRLGLDATTRFVQAGSPFDFKRQARLYIPKDLPNPSGSTAMQWSREATEQIRRLVELSRGRALLLFTSRREMDAAWLELVPTFDGWGYPCMKQGDASNGSLLERFKREESSVLFALRSFFTGVDIQGDSLSLVVINKLPFPVPTDPVFEARSEEIKRRGGSDFTELTVPMMTLPLQQAAGRLIRTVADRGVVAILDPRIVTKGYGDTVRRSLPDMPMVHRLQDVEAFFASAAS